MRDPRVILGVLVSALATALLLYVINPWEVLSALRQANVPAVITSAALIALAMWIKTVRWRLFFPAPERVRHGGLHESLYIGYMVNTMLPLRAGELVRAFLAAEAERTQRSTTVATVLIEKVIDLVTMALILFLLGQISHELPDSARYAAVLSGVGLAAVIGGIGFALVARDQAIRLATATERHVPLLARIGVAGLLGSFLDGLAFARHAGIFGMVIVWTFVHWAISGASIACALVAVGIVGGSPLQLLEMVLMVMVATNLSMAVPSAPGYVGVFHGVFVAALALFSIREESAMAAAVIEHAVVFGVFILGGAYYVLRGQTMRASGRRLAGLVTRARAASPAS